jgi:hypothetical protein
MKIVQQITKKEDRLTDTAQLDYKMMNHQKNET